MLLLRRLRQMGRVYLQPREYLEYVRARPTEPEPPPNDADVLGSSEDEWEVRRERGRAKVRTSAVAAVCRCAGLRGRIRDLRT